MEINELKELTWRIASNQKEWKVGGKLKLITRIKNKLQQQGLIE